MLYEYVKYRVESLTPAVGFGPQAFLQAADP